MPSPSKVAEATASTTAAVVPAADHPKRRVINTEVHQFIEQAQYYQGSLRELAGMLPTDDTELDTWIAEAVKASDANVFVFLVMSALGANRPVQVRHLTRGAMLIPEKLTLGIFASHMQGEIDGPLLEAVSSLRLPSTELVSSALFLAAKWQQEHGNGRLSDRLISAARSAARNKGNAEYDRGLLQVVATISGDDALKALLLDRKDLKPGDPMIKRMEDAASSLGEQMLRIWRLPPLLHVPANPSRMLAEGNTLRRAAARTGRNEPCPCGSGKKYKHCCIEKDQERLRHSTSVAGVTDAELHANPERYLTTLDLDSYAAHEVARLDPLKLAPDLWEPYLANLCRAKMYDTCVEAFEKLGYNNDLKVPWDNILLRIAQARRKDLVERMMKLRPDSVNDRLLGGVELFLAEQDPAKTVQLLQEGPLTLLTDDQVKQYPGFAHTLLKSNLCALGIFVARGMVATLPQNEATALLDDLLRTRDKLGLSPDDPISDVLDKRMAEDDTGHSKQADSLRQAQRALSAKAEEVWELKESLARLQKDIARREETRNAPVPSPVDEAALRESRRKVEELKSELKERHNERNAARREVQKLQADNETLRQTATPSPDEEARADAREEDLLLPEETASNQPVRVIEFPRDFPQTLRRVPPSVARGTMALLGRLAAGEPSAFMNAVRLKACPDILRRRIGIDFRLLFRLLPDRVQVVDLIPRQDLERKIKTLV